MNGQRGDDPLIHSSERDGSGKEALVSGCFGTQGSVAPPRVEEVGKIVCRMCGVFNDVLCLLPGPSGVQVLGPQ